MSKVKIRFSSALRPQTKEPETTIEFEGELEKALEALVEKYGPDFRKRVFDESGNLRKFISIYINGDDIRFKDGVKTDVSGGDEILILPAVSGG